MFSKNKVFILPFLFVILLSTGNISINAQKQIIRLTIKDKREIIKLILQTYDFSQALELRTPEYGELLLSTENIPKAIQDNFPQIEGVKFEFITPEYIRNNATIGVERFSFGSFKVKHNKVFVYFNRTYFGGGGTGIEYVLQRNKRGWKINPPSRFNTWDT